MPFKWLLLCCTLGPVCLQEAPQCCTPIAGWLVGVGSHSSPACFYVVSLSFLVQTLFSQPPVLLQVELLCLQVHSLYLWEEVSSASPWAAVWRLLISLHSHWMHQHRREGRKNLCFSLTQYCFVEGLLVICMAFFELVWETKQFCGCFNFCIFVKLKNNACYSPIKQVWFWDFNRVTFVFVAF